MTCVTELQLESPSCAFGSRFPNEREILSVKIHPRALIPIFHSSYLHFIHTIFSLSDYSSTTRTRTLCAGYFGIPNALVPRSSRTRIKFFVLFFGFCLIILFLFSFLRSIDRLLLLYSMHFT
jgi:hypothetical protein